MESVAAENRINTNHRLWPKAANAVTKRLNQIRSNLLEGLGISITIDRDTKKNTSSIKMVKQPPEPPEPPEPENHAQNPSVPEVQNHAQNPNSGGSGDNGGFFHTEGGNMG
jgi:hypothetical protein